MTTTTDTTEAPVRPLHVIARDIYATWVTSRLRSNVSYAAVPYLAAMLKLDKITDRYGQDDGRTIVTYFLSNARSFTGPDAKRIKAELRSML